MADTYTCWVMMDCENGVISPEFDSAGAVLKYMIYDCGYSIYDLRNNGFTLNHLLCDSSSWLECLDEPDFSEWSYFLDKEFD